MVTRHLDLGCGPTPRNPYRRDEAHGIDIAVPAGLDGRFFRRANLAVEPIPHEDSSLDSVLRIRLLRARAAPARHAGWPRHALSVRRADERDPSRAQARRPPLRGDAGLSAAEAFHDPTHVNDGSPCIVAYFCGATAPGAQITATRPLRAARERMGAAPGSARAERAAELGSSSAAACAQRRVGHMAAWEFAA